MPYHHSKIGILSRKHTSTILDGCQALPEEGVVVVATPEKSKLLRIRSCLFKILFAYCILNQIKTLVVLHDVIVVMFVVVKVH